MEQLRDHPVIRNLERTGYPDGKEPQYPICPVCGAECGTIYKNKAGCIVACDEEISQWLSVSAWEEPECFPEKE